MAAYNNQRTKHISAVRTAVDAEVDRLTPLLEDSDAQVRDGVAFALSQCPKSKRRSLPKLRARFAAEAEPQMKARLLAAVQWLDTKTPLVGESLGADQPVAIRAAATLILARSTQPWTPEATDAVRDAWAGGEPLEKSWWWGWQSSPLQGLITSLGDRGADGAAVLGMLLASSSDLVRAQAAAAAVFVVRAERQARPLLVPVLQRTLVDAPAKIRHDAARALGEAGAAARPAADSLADAVPTTPAALDALVWLDDPRWPAFAAAQLDNAAHVKDTLQALHEARVPFHGEVMDAITRTDPADWHRWGIYLLAAWGPPAAPGVPQLQALLDTNVYAWALDALTAIGRAAQPVLPRLRATLDGPLIVKAADRLRVSHLAERIGIWRIGADPGPALEAARAALTTLRGRSTGGFYDLPHDDADTLLDALGEHGRDLRSQVLDLLTARPDFIGLARALWRWTANPDEIRPTVLTVLDRAGTQFRQRTPQYPGPPAIDLALELADPSLAPLLRPFLADSTSRTRVPAARAIWRLTGDTTGLIGPLLKEVTGRPPGFRWNEALDLLAEIGPAAADAHTELRATAEHPRCPFVDDLDSSRDCWLGHHDDRFLAATRATIAAITPAT
ncbi:hypothetical protein ABZS66_05435 [Dactylosporangium sp. NPDC005572]|uniref:hypothetical protein n=1 Tax=Dactylosporangium sp. NPDC005572 TaxID=3156889 RepID=UPI0033B4DA8C